jgi:hypothetical protein
MRIRWFGQSAFLLEGERSVVVDPFGDAGDALAGRVLEFRYPPMNDVRVDLVLVTHEHIDHNGVDAVGGNPQVIRSIAGRFDSPVGEVVAIASSTTTWPAPRAARTRSFASGSTGSAFATSVTSASRRSDPSSMQPSARSTSSSFPSVGDRRSAPSQRPIFPHSMHMRETGTGENGSRAMADRALRRLGLHRIFAETFAEMSAD